MKAGTQEAWMDVSKKQKRHWKSKLVGQSQITELPTV
jgi:hypothetical protein